MKRRTIDASKLRRPVKRSRITDSVNGSWFLYVRFFLIWFSIISFDFMLEFRFEFLWPFWLLIRSTFDSFRYQGMGLTIIFLCITLFSDVLCFLFLPIHWLFFIASTYVWVQFICNTERGPCLPTIALWLLFVYVEASLRLREIKSLPFHLDICRPFAAHCIGYPVVSLGYGFKSFVGYKIKHYKQEEVSKQNNFYHQLVSYALPVEVQEETSLKKPTVNSNSKIDNENLLAIENNIGKRIVKPEVDEKHQANGTLSLNDLEVISNHNSSIRDLNRTKNNFHHNESNENGFVKVTSLLSRPNSSFNKTNSSCNGDVLSHSSTRKNSRINRKQTVDNSDEDNLLDISDSDGSTNSGRHDHSPKSTGRNHSNKSTDISVRHKEEQQQRRKAEQQVAQLEFEVKKLRSEVHATKQAESETRTQFNASQIAERYLKAEMEQVRSDNETLQQKINSLNSLKSQDKAVISSLERKLKSEKEQRASLETQLKDLKKKSDKDISELPPSRENHDSCIAKQQEFELEISKLKSKLEESTQELNELKKENDNIKRKNSENDREKMKKDVEFLTNALNTMQGKNLHLETSLSSETRLKLDLFSALGETRRQYEIVQSQMKAKCNEVDLLKAKIAEVMAVMPPQYHSSLSGFVSQSDSASTTFMSTTAPATVVTTAGYTPAVGKQNGIK